MGKKLCVRSLIVILLFCVIIQWEGVSYANQVSGLVSGYVYNVINKASGKCLNVNYGTDANGTNVTQYSKEGSLEQRFKLSYNSSRDAYKLYAVCSNNNRVLDILRTGGSASGSISSGCNVDIWSDNDNDAQDFVIINRGDGYYSLHPRINMSLSLTTYGTGNGSGAGVSSTSVGNVFVSAYTGSDNQLWRFSENTVRAYCYTSLANKNDFVYWNNYYLTKMGYRYTDRENPNTSNFLSDLQNSEIFLYYGHGQEGGGILLGNGNETTSEMIFAKNGLPTTPIIDNLSQGSLNNTKFVVYYACFAGAFSNEFGNIVTKTYDKGATCALEWDIEIYTDEVVEWNRLLLEKIYNENQSIVEGYRHADYWLPSICGEEAAVRMGASHRKEAGDNTIHLYK